MSFVSLLKYEPNFLVVSKCVNGRDPLLLELFLEFLDAVFLQLSLFFVCRSHISLGFVLVRLDFLGLMGFSVVEFDEYAGLILEAFKRLLPNAELVFQRLQAD